METREQQLTDALRAILPYAENEIEGLYSHVRDVPEVQAEIEKAEPILERARALLLTA